MHHSNRGPGAATTKGLAEVTTPIVATLDSDDLWHQEKAERQLEHLEDNPDVSANFTLLELFSSESDDARTGRVTPGWSRTTMMLRMDLYHRVGEMRDPPGMRGELVDWIARARELGARLEMLEEVLAYRRIRAGSLSDRRVAEQDRGYVHAARAAIERRRSKTSGR